MPPDPLVLVVEDDPAIAQMMAMRLDASGYRSAVVRDGLAALAAVQDRRPAVVLLDIGLPGIDGIEVCRRMRTAGDWTPVLFVTARDDEVDRVVGLELGADDYITKPFSPREVIARIGSVLRRARVASSGDSTDGGQEGRALEAGAVRLVPEQRLVFVDGRETALTATEFDLLAHLMARPGRVYTRDELLRQVWGYDSSAGQRTVDVHVAQVRAKLGEHDVIRTVRGVGYAAQRAPLPDPGAGSGGAP